MDFIYQEKIQDLTLCQDIIDFFKDHPGNTAGTVGGKLDYQVRLNHKDSTENILNINEELAHRYCKNLQIVVNNYVEKFPFCNFYSSWGIVEKINVQFYKPNQAFHAYHTERTGSSMPSAARHLVFMTYLNDVTDAGETEFLHQNIKFKPETGLTLIWPADWTYTHRGIPSPTQEKAIVTGWFNFTE